MGAKFQSWEEFNKVTPPYISIPRPPCENCKHFRPVAKFHGDTFVGVQLCHSQNEQEKDFSCYREIEDNGD